MLHDGDKQVMVVEFKTTAGTLTVTLLLLKVQRRWKTQAKTLHERTYFISLPSNPGLHIRQVESCYELLWHSFTANLGGKYDEISSDRPAGY